MDPYRPHPPRRGLGYGPAPAPNNHRLPAPAPPDHSAARAAARYHQALGVGRLAPGLRPAPARQDGPLAYQAQAGACACQHYGVALTSYRTRQAQLARQWQELLARPAAPTAVIRQGEACSPGEIARREREMKLQKAYGEYVENVNLISGEFAPLVLYDPVIQGTAQGGLMVMGGVALGAVVPAGVGAAYTVLGLRASYAALRTAPMAFGEAAARVLLDFSGQYGANLILRKGPIGSFSEINLLETGMAGLGMNP